MNSDSENHSNYTNKITNIKSKNLKLQIIKLLTFHSIFSFSKHCSRNCKE